MKRILYMAALMLALCAAARAEFAEAFPEALRFTQQTQTQAVAQDIYIKRVYPDTASDAVDGEMREVIDRLAAAGEAHLPTERVTIPSYLDVGANISRSGESVLSFLTIAEISREKEQLYVDYDARVYDAATGARLTLTDFFAEESGIYDLLAREIRAQLSAAFPGISPDAAALDALCGEDAVKDAPFTMGAARMTLTYRADAIYPGKHSLLHVHLYYPQLRAMMTEFGLRQTDNSRYKMVALTYDDGGARGTTRAVLDHLRDTGAMATFFVVGERCGNNHDILLKQQDTGHSIQSHTYAHRYPDELRAGDAQREKERMEALLGELTGVVPTMMRAPGGHYRYYVNREIGYPLMQWSLASGDSGNPHYDKIAERVIGCASDGAVILMHDINQGSPTYTGRIVRNFAERGILCVTIEELYSDAGVTLEANKAYKNPYQMAE